MSLKTRYNPVYGNEYYLGDTRSIPDWKIHSSYRFYDYWPYTLKISLTNRPIRRWLTTPTYYRQNIFTNTDSTSIVRYSSYY